MIKLLIFISLSLLFNISCSTSHLTEKERELIDNGVKSRSKEDDVIIKVDKMPEPLGGISAIQKKIQYPDSAKKNNIEGNVIIQCLITKEGAVKELRILKGIGFGCDEEAVRVINSTKFYPGEYNNKKVDVITTIPIIFKLK